MEGKRFAGLDGLRFISISFVVWHHLLTFKSYFGFSDIDFPIIGVIGHYGIHFFFTGSGFLITYLLLVEHSRFGKINLKNFFIRRILRIWPAYFFLILLMLLVYQQPFFQIPDLTEAYVSGAQEKSNLLYLLLLPHLSPFVNSTAPYVHPTYTIGIEEQFYILWGGLFVLFAKRFKKLMVIIAISGPTLNFVHHYLYRYTSQYQDASSAIIFLKQALYYFKYSKISVFAIGSLLGIAFFEKQSWIYALRKKSIQLVLYSLLAVSLISGVQLPFLQFEYMALLTGLVMMAGTFKDESIFNFSSPWLEHLGRISYGIYLFHIFAIVFAIKILGEYFELPLNSPLQIIILELLTLSIAILLGYLSYHLLESKFLNIKNRFKRI